MAQVSKAARKLHSPNSRPNPSHKPGDGLPRLLFDLDGTLIDTVYQHVTAWAESLRSEKILLPTWRIHRHIGMSAESFVHELAREADSKRPLNIERLEHKHDAAFNKMQFDVLPGAAALLKHLHHAGVKWAIATTGGRDQTKRLLRPLTIPSGVPIITGDDVERAKPAPDVFVSAAAALDSKIEDCIVIGDSVWDVLAAARKRALGVGLQSGGYSHEELERAGAFRVYTDPADLLVHIEDLGIPGS